MQNIINEYIGGLKLGRKQSYKNLTVFALLSDYNADSDYLTLDEALSGNLIDVVEKNEGGTVPELKVVNKSDRMVLILDGEELVGAKQNKLAASNCSIRTSDPDPKSVYPKIRSRRRHPLPAHFLKLTL